ncbi:unnamed protein product [Gadus morhua 'NCC']
MLGDQCNVERVDLDGLRRQTYLWRRRRRGHLPPACPAQERWLSLGQRFASGLRTIAEKAPSSRSEIPLSIVFNWRPSPKREEVELSIFTPSPVWHLEGNAVKTTRSGETHNKTSDALGVRYGMSVPGVLDNTGMRNAQCLVFPWPGCTHPAFVGQECVESTLLVLLLPDTLPSDALRPLGLLLPPPPPHPPYSHPHHHHHLTYMHPRIPPTPHPQTPILTTTSPTCSPVS